MVDTECPRVAELFMEVLDALPLHLRLMSNLSVVLEDRRVDEPDLLAHHLEINDHRPQVTRMGLSAQAGLSQ